MVLPKTLLRLAEESACFVYAVGGCVRTNIGSLLSKGAVFSSCETLNTVDTQLTAEDRLSENTDIDICGSADIDQMRKALSPCFRLTPVNKRTGTFVISLAGERFEYTPFRTESYKEDGSHTPISVQLGAELHDDAMRRDFCCNAVFYDIKNRRYIDYTDGVGDIVRHSLRAVDLERTLDFDALRILRLVRFAVTLGFAVERGTFLAAQKNVKKLAAISGERIFQELKKILSAPRFFQGVRLLSELGALPFVTGADVRECAFLLTSLADTSEALPCFIYDCAQGDARRAGDILTFLKASNAERADNLKFFRLSAGLSALRTPCDALRLGAECSDFRGAAIRFAGILAQTGAVSLSAVKLLTEAFGEIAKNGSACSVCELCIDGTDIKKHMRGLPAEKIGTVLRQLFDTALINGVKNTREALLPLLKALPRREGEEDA